MDRTWSGDGAAVVAGLPLLAGAPGAGGGPAQQRKEGQQGESEAHHDVHRGLEARLGCGVPSAPDTRIAREGQKALEAMLEANRYRYSL